MLDNANTDLIRASFGLYYFIDLCPVSREKLIKNLSSSYENFEHYGSNKMSKIIDIGS